MCLGIDRCRLTSACFGLWLAVSVAYAQEAPVPDNARGLLIGGYRCGVATGWGIYQWDEAHGDLQLLLEGGKHPTYLERGRYWACYWNGTARFLGMRGTRRDLGMAGYVSDTARFVQSTMSGKALVLMLGPFGEMSPIALDLDLLFRTPEVAVTPAAVLEDEETLLVDTLQFLNIPAEQPNPPSIADFAVSPDGAHVALVVTTRLWDVGVQVSRLVIYDMRTRQLRLLQAERPVQLQMNPHWVAGGRELVFDAVDAASGARTTWLAKLSDNTLSIFTPKLERQARPHTWVLGTSPDGELLALGAAWTGATPKRPLALLVCRRNGDIIGKSMNRPAGDLWDACWSPDGRRIAFVYSSQLSGDYEPFQTDALGACVGVMSLDGAPERVLYQALPQLESGRQGPVVPYEVAW